LPELIDGRCLVFELISRFHHDEGRAGDQAACLQKPIDTGFGDVGSFSVRERDGNLARAEIRLFKGKLNDFLADLIWNAVPDAFGSRPVIFQRIEAAHCVAIIPGIERRLGNANLSQRTSHR